MIYLVFQIAALEDDFNLGHEWEDSVINLMTIELIISSKYFNKTYTFMALKQKIQVFFFCICWLGSITFILSCLLPCVVRQNDFSFFFFFLNIQLSSSNLQLYMHLYIQITDWNSCNQVSTFRFSTLFYSFPNSKWCIHYTAE